MGIYANDVNSVPGEYTVVIYEGDNAPQTLSFHATSGWDAWAKAKELAGRVSNVRIAAYPAPKPLNLHAIQAKILHALGPDARAVNTRLDEQTGRTR